MDPRGTETPTPWALSLLQGAMVSRVWQNHPHLGSVNCQLCEPTDAGDLLHTSGPRTEITRGDVCAGPAHRRLSVNAGSYPPDFPWIISHFKSPDQVFQPQREAHRGTAGVGAITRDTNGCRVRVCRNDQIMKHLISFQRSESFSSRRQVNSQPNVSQSKSVMEKASQVPISNER